MTVCLQISGIKEGKTLTVSIKEGGRTRWEVTPKTFKMGIEEYPLPQTTVELENYKDLQQLENEIEDIKNILSIKEILTDNPFVTTTDLLKIIGDTTPMSQLEAKRIVYAYEGRHWDRHRQSDKKTYKWSIVEKEY